MSYPDKWKQRASGMKTDVYVLYLARRDPRIPWYAKALAVVTVAYAFSPIDLIPDFIPVLGYLDDLVLIPLGVALVLRMVPREIWTEYEEKAAAGLASSKPKSRVAAAVVIIVWLLVLAWVAHVVYRLAT